MKKHLIALLTAVALVAFANILPASAQAPVLHNEAAAGPNAGAAAPLNVMPQGIIYGSSAAVAGIAGTGEQVLGTFAMPAGTLDVVGRRLRLTANFQHAANTNNVTPKLYFGSEALATAVGATSGQAYKLECDVLKTGASTQQVTCWGLGGAAGVVPVTYSAAGAETDTAAITLKADCTGGTTGADCTLSDFYVEILN
jgi:hypothetical protein